MRQTKISFAVSCLLFLLLPSYGQTPAPKLGYIRFWDMLPATSGTFEVRKANASVSEPAMLIGTAYRYSGYGEFPVGKYRLGVFKQGENRPVKIFDVDLRPNTYFTILISPQSIDMFDDTIDPETTTGTLTVRNYFNGVVVAVSSGAQKIVDALPYGQSHIANGLPLSRLPVTLRTSLPNGRPAEAGAEVDFKTSKRVTLLIVPDSYGRFRARVTVDGKNL
jgi:hypothetical protein